jgi:hypothetical protein
MNFKSILRPGAFTHAKIAEQHLTVGTFDCAYRAPLNAPACLPDYEALARAMRGFEQPAFALTEAGNLRISEGARSIVVPTKKDQVDFLKIISRKEDFTHSGRDLIEACTALRGFVTPDPTNKWFRNGLVVDRGVVTAFDGNACAQYRLQEPFEGASFGIPVGAVDVLTSIAEPCVVRIVEGRKAFFSFAGNCALSSTLLAGTVPDFELLFKGFGEGFQELSHEVVADLRGLNRTAEERSVFISKGVVSTDKNYHEKGAHLRVAFPSPPKTIEVVGDAFDQMLKYAEWIAYASPHIYWCGGQMRGVVIAREVG